MTRDEYTVRRENSEKLFIEAQLEQLLAGHTERIINRTCPPHYAVDFLKSKGFTKLTYNVDQSTFCRVEIKDMFHETFIMIVNYDCGMRMGFRLYRYSYDDEGPMVTRDY